MKRGRDDAEENSGAASGETTPPDHEQIEAAAARVEANPESTESDADLDDDAEPRGAGQTGRGPPMRVGKGAWPRILCDGAGEPYKMFAALETMAVLLAVIAFGPQMPASQ